MDKQQILEEINKTKKHLTNMEKMLKECEYGRWKPSEGEEYWILDSWGMAYNEIWTNSNSDPHRYDFYNCFQTREQAEQEGEKILVRRKLEDIARRLNEGRKINWNDEEQSKYSIYLDTIDNEISWDSETKDILQGVVYCLEPNFLDVAIREIGEERLIKYLKSE